MLKAGRHRLSAHTHDDMIGLQRIAGGALQFGDGFIQVRLRALDSRRAVVNAVWRSSTRKTVDCPSSNLRCSLAYCCSAAERCARGGAQFCLRRADALQSIADFRLNVLFELFALRRQAFAFDQRTSELRLRRAILAAAD